MESNGLLLVIKLMHAKYNGEYFLDTIVTDDDTKMKKCITHPAYKPRGWINHGGSLPLDVPVPIWFTNMTHRDKCVTCSFYEMSKGAKSPNKATKIDYLRMKKYYSYFVKQNQ